MHLRPYFRKTLAIFAAIGISLAVIGCAGPAHCPGVASTGNYKPSKSSRKGYKGKSSRKCPGTASTGNYKPKQKRRKPEDGLYSKKMKKAMADSEAE